MPASISAALKRPGARSVMQADVDKAHSDVTRYQAAEQQAKAQISQKKAGLKQLEAQVRQAEANLKIARIQLDYTQVRSPISGKIGRAEVTIGDYVSPGSVLLARVVQVKPIRVRFAISDRDYMDIMKNNAGAGLKGIKAGLFLPNGDPYQKQGSLDFISNRMSMETGTIALRMRYDNQSGTLVPNSYVKVMVEMPWGRQEPYRAPRRRCSPTPRVNLFTWWAGRKALPRYLRLGGLIGARRVVEYGLTAGENVVVQGLQKVRPGAAVKTAGGKPEAARKGAKS